MCNDCFVAKFLQSLARKNFENRLIFGEVIDMTCTTCRKPYKKDPDLVASPGHLVTANFYV